MEIAGVKIKDVRPLTTKEMEREGWDKPCMVIELENGVLLYPSMDEEGNGPGALFGYDTKTKKQFGLM
jgi:hypothetical protein